MVPVPDVLAGQTPVGYHPPVAALHTADVAALLAQLRAGRDGAWEEFLERFAPLLLQAASFVERDRDAAADAFVFICERLHHRRSSRLATYDPARPGSFDTWLRAVAVNLARDSRRQRVGRLRPLAFARRMSPLEQRVLQLRHEAGCSLEQTLAALAPEFPGLSEAHLAEADAYVSAQLSSKRRWWLVARRPRFEPFDHTEEDEERLAAALGSMNDPEWAVLAREGRAMLTAAIAALPPEDRLLLKLHFKKGLTLAAMVPIVGATNPQAVHRRIQGLVGHLRAELAHVL
jgi:DNA-directed RNA polymerase specialized sigma24 family protein